MCGNSKGWYESLREINSEVILWNGWNASSILAIDTAPEGRGGEVEARRRGRERKRERESEGVGKMEKCDNR